MIPTIQKGLLTELQCQKDFSNLGILLSQPIVNDSRYDFLADIDKKIYKIQCKSSSLSDDKNFIQFRCISRNWNNNKIKYYYEDDVDFFYTCYNNIGYLIPIKDIGNRRDFILRFFSESNNSNIHWAKDYEIKKIINKISNINYENFKDETVIRRSKNKVENYCIDCNTLISPGSNRCKKCNDKFISSLSGINNTTRGELKNMIRTLPFTEIGKIYNVTDSTVGKWCKKITFRVKN